MIRRNQIVAVIIAVALSTSGCRTDRSGLDGEKALELLREHAVFNTKLSETGENASVYFPDLPEGCTATHYGGSGYYADEVAVITLGKEADRPAAIRAVNKHLEELRLQYLSYIPEEVDKIDNAVIFETDREILLCITNDYEEVNKLLINASNIHNSPMGD